MDKDLKTLISQRASIKGRVTLFQKYLDVVKLASPDSLTPIIISELEFKYNRFRELINEFDKIQCKIESLVTDLDPQLIERDQLETSFASLVATAQIILDASTPKDIIKNCEGSTHSSCCGNSKNNNLSVKLPTINIPSFDGNYLNWLEYRDTFDALINKNNSIPDITKFHYLRSSLTSSAAIVIRSIEFTSDNFKIAWNLLCDRFNNTRILVNNHIKSLFSFEPVTKESHKSLRYMIDYYTKNLRALESLGEPTSSWDTLIIFMMTSRLDTATGRKWEEHKGRLSSSPTLDEFIRYLRSHADVLETIQVGALDGRKQYDRSVSYHNKETKNTKSFITSSDNNTVNNKCTVCNQDQHLVYQCTQFKQMTLNDKLSTVSRLKLCPICLRSGHSKFKCRFHSCLLCKKRHNILLHVENYKNTNSNVIASTSAANASIEDKSNPLTLTAVSYPKQVLLCTAEIELVNLETKTTHRAKALLDCGSQSSFITSNIKTVMNINTTKMLSEPISVCGINNSIAQIKEQCHVGIKSTSSSFQINVSCLVIPEITSKLPSCLVDYKTLNIPANVKLADKTFYQPSNIDVLLGADVFWKIVMTDQMSLGEHKPTLTSSHFGWLVGGPTGNISSTNVSCNFSQEIKDSLAKFWEIEDLPNSSTKKDLTDEQAHCEAHFIETTTRLADGRFTVRLPLRDCPETTLGDSLLIAKRRFFNLETKLLKCSNRKDYIEFINEYERLGHLNEIEPPKFGYYIPHHAVIREHSETTRLRVVFDASCKTTSSKSLNDLQLVGPVVQSDLMSILLRFRQHTYVVTGDIEKMYRQIMVEPSQRHLQLILWREDPSLPLRTLQLNTVTYGTASAPYLSTRCLIELANECPDKLIANKIKNDMYVDDMATGSDTKSELIHIVQGVTEQLSKGCFNLRKFRTNVPDIFDNVPNITATQEFSKDSSVLGLKWAPTSDKFQFSANLKVSANVTKRNILATSCKIFDPLGLLSACTIIPKMLLQKLWLLKLGWDEIVPESIRHSWCEFLDNVHHLAEIEVDRHVVCANAIDVELHCFSDASLSAYGTSIYLKSVNNNDIVTVNLLCAKQRVAPLKPELTIPRLELLGAQLGAQLYNKVINSITVKLSRVVFWTDSSIVLSWLKSSPKTLKVFASNRIDEIRKITENCTWRYVPSGLNPADLLSRGIKPQQLANNTFWWHGPSFLALSEHEWPPNIFKVSGVLPEIKTSLIIQFTTSLIPFEKFSRLKKLQRIIAYVLRYINNCDKKKTKLTGEITPAEMQSALVCLAKESQKVTFSKDIHSLTVYKKLNNKSSILSLNPFLDDNGILRVGGRINKALNCPYERKHPILIGGKHIFSKLLFESEHLRLLHCGPQQLLHSTREQFWSTGGRLLASSTVNKCYVCKRYKAKTLMPLMGELPKPRVSPAPPFETCGTDFAGPFLISNNKGRGAKVSKCYLCIFICFSVKAVHLEVVSELSTNAFILCLRRFISRRGKPNVIYCDNGKNFVGANNELNRMLASYNRTVEGFASDEGISFKFSPVYSPNFGGIWEAGVKAAKFHLKRIAGNSSLTFEELSTLFSQVEAIMNSRPLTPLSSDPSDLAPLTPGHFLIGRPLASLPSPVTEKISVSRYELVERLRQHFWNRWSNEYLSTLQPRTKWRINQEDIEVGNLVVIKEDNVPPMKWLMGRVIKKYSGADGICRVVDLFTKKGTIKRAVSKLCPLLNKEES